MLHMTALNTEVVVKYLEELLIVFIGVIDAKEDIQFALKKIMDLSGLVVLE